MLGLRFCARAFSSCGERGPLFIAVRGPLTIARGLCCCGAQSPDVQAQQLWLTGPVAARHVGSSQTRARTRVPCIGRQILNHCATREALRAAFDSLWHHHILSRQWPPQDPSEICFAFSQGQLGSQSHELAQMCWISLWETDAVFCFLKMEQEWQGHWATVMSKLDSRVMAPTPLLQTPHFILTTVQGGVITILRVRKLRFGEVNSVTLSGVPGG